MIQDFPDVFLEELLGLLQDREVAFLGHIVLAEGIWVDPNKIKRKSAHLTKLLQKDVKSEWTNERQSSFVRLKLALTEAPMLVQPMSKKDFMVYSDAFITGLGCVLMQDDSVVAYVSRQMKSH
ncbi:uncharacterized protein LOC120120733 [Hibiscus syriacus]|uniref:uncharacterized protein LOC120120733 n=1 Tax=Hibiscus syriacus TaxID=106335 RepID=UPI001923EAD0|nr:uncharacterized protein LOC120120733 [Hibiscus syriacus]